jgi:hypothetical protein
MEMDFLGNSINLAHYIGFGVRAGGVDSLVFPTWGRRIIYKSVVAFWIKGGGL